MLLAIDTSTSAASLALATPDETLAELDWNVGRRHSTELLQRLEWLLATTGVRIDALTGISVATGPGSFNGIRVALTTAKSLALAQNLPLYGVATLDVSAWGYAYVQGPLWALIEAGRGQVYAARYIAPAASPIGWRPVNGYEVLTPEELVARVQSEARPEDGPEAGSAFFCGEWRPETRTVIESCLGERARFASPLQLRRGCWLAELGQAQAAQGLRASPAELEPLYLRRPNITTSSKRGLPRSSQTSAASAGITGARVANESEGEETSHALYR